jgi:hypothetical protein
VSEVSPTLGNLSVIAADPRDAPPAMWLFFDRRLKRPIRLAATRLSTDILKDFLDNSAQWAPGFLRAHSSTTSPMVFVSPLRIQAMKSLSNLKPAPQCSTMNLRTF